MFYKTIFVCLVGLLLVKLVKSDPLNNAEITFTIKIQKNNKKVLELICDHDDDSKQKNKYTVLEGNTLKIVTKFRGFIDHFFCSDYHGNKIYKQNNGTDYRNVTIINKEMGNLWKCSVWSNKNNALIKPVVSNGNHTYSAAYCYMKLHVRQKKPPQTILVNRMALTAVRTDLSEKKDIDLTAEYRYADGDEVDVACVNFLQTATLTIEYAKLEKLSDKFNGSSLSSSQGIGFITKLHSEDNGSHMICTNTEQTDYTKVMVKFVMQEKPNFVSIKINGMNLRPELEHKPDEYKINYWYMSREFINVTCEVKQTDIMELVVTPSNFCDGKNGCKITEKTDQFEKKKVIQSQVTFSLNNETETLSCSSDYRRKRGQKVNTSGEITGITFSKDFPNDPPMNMDVPPNGIVMKVYYYVDTMLHMFIFYEFEDGETLHVKCGPLRKNSGGPLFYMKLNGSSKFPDQKPIYDDRKNISLKLNLTDEHDNFNIACYLMEQEEEVKDIVYKEISLILRKRLLTTTTTTTSTTTTTGTSITINTDTTEQTTDQGDGHSFFIAAIAGAVAGIIIIICVSTVIFKLRKRNHSQRGPRGSNYENLTTALSETSIPAYPPQWESNYAVPVDRRTDDTTYSVPCHEQPLYATPTPKNMRNNKKEPEDLTYATLQMPNAKGQKNVFKETDDPNYAEVYADRQEQCYGKVLPKSVRNKMTQDNTYSNVANEPAYANAGEPEYCVPANVQNAQYANLNNSHYVNSNAQEYVEPTYCEPQKRMK